MTKEDKAEMLRIVSSCAWPMVSDHPFATFADRLADEAARLSAPDEQAAAPSPVPQEGLLPCPFCGAAPIYHFVGDDDGGYHAVECRTCNGSTRGAGLFCGVHSHDKAEARSAWNRRTAAAPSGEGWVFARYVNGKRMAEGIRINGAATAEEAAERANRLVSGDEGPTVLIQVAGLVETPSAGAPPAPVTTGESAKRWLELNPHDCDSPAIYMAEMKERGDAMAASIGRLEEKLVLFDAIRKESIERREKLEAAEARLKAAEEEKTAAIEAAEEAVKHAYGNGWGDYQRGCSLSRSDSDRCWEAMKEKYPALTARKEV